MKDLSPSERQVLERAAEYVSVYERESKPKPFIFDRGCFECDHGLSLSQEHSYTTLQIYNQHDEMLFSAVVAQVDRFYRPKGPSYGDRSWWGETLRYVTDTAYCHWPRWNGRIIAGNALEENNILYVRLVLDFDTWEIRHINNRVDLLDYMPIDPEWEYMLRVTPRTLRAVYVDPTCIMAENAVIDPETIRAGNEVHNNLQKIFSVTRGPVLKPLRKNKNDKETTVKKLKEKKVVLPPHPLNWDTTNIIEAATFYGTDIVNGPAFNPTEQGNP